MVAIAGTRNNDGVIAVVIAAACSALALGAGLLAGVVVDPWIPLTLASAFAFVTIIAARPVLGAFLWLLVGPLIVGIARGNGMFVLRPNEALLLLILCGLALNVLWRIYLSERLMPRLNAVDGALLLFTLAGSLVPMVIRYGRGLPLSTDDVLYAIVFVKYFLLYAVFRLSVTSQAEVASALKLALLSGIVVGVIAILQVQGLLGVNEILSRYYDSPFEGSVGAHSTRGSSTIASSFGLADMMAMCLAISLAAAFILPRHRLVAVSACLVFAASGIAAGSFSGVIGLFIVVAVVGFLHRRLILLAALGLPLMLLAAVSFWPVIAARLDGFDRYQGMPRSWLGRLENLERFFWPELTSGYNWLLGVRPAARVAAPELWRDWVYIESGHTWLLWTGGLPLLLAFLFFFWVTMKVLYRMHRERAEGWSAVAASAALAASAMIFGLMLFDPHLTVRGSADLFFPLIALALVPLSWDAPKSRADT